MEYELRYHHNVFEIKLWGMADAAGFVSMVDDLLSHKNWLRGRKVLIDLSLVQPDQMTVEEIRKVVHHCRVNSSKIGSSKCAILAPSFLVNSLARLWQVFMTGDWDVDVTIFNSSDNLLQWVGDSKHLQFSAQQ